MNIEAKESNRALVNEAQCPKSSVIFLTDFNHF